VSESNVCMIERVELRPEHVGRRVRYVDPWMKRESVGVLSSFRNDAPRGPAIWVRFNSESGERCPPERLRWEEPGEGSSDDQA
jgi:hypothetical protein